jgi:molecular chaperone GrpE
VRVVREVAVAENIDTKLTGRSSEEGERTTGSTKSDLQQSTPSQPATIPGTAGGEAAAEEAAPPDPLEEAKAQAVENRDRWIRAVADLENFKKRTAQERSRLIKYRNEELLRDLLPLVDNLDRAFSHCAESGRSDAVSEGICMIAKMFREILTRHGVTEIEALAKPFNPEFHEAIAQIPSPDAEPNLVVQEMEKGYLYHDRLLRPAKVVVSAGKAQQEHETEHD